MASSSLPPDATGSEEIRVLHVDDDEAFAETAATFLERADDRLAVATRPDAEGGLAHLRDNEVDCIVSDHDMPKKDGIEFLEAVRKRRPELPFVLYTGKGSEAVASEAISAGVTDYLQKETGTDQYELLANKIHNAVTRIRAEDARKRHLEAIETAQEGISILNRDGEFVYVNRAYAELYGYAPEEMLGEHWSMISPDDETDFVRGTVIPTVEETGRWQGETTGVRSDGSTFPELHTVSLTESGDLVCTVRDGTERAERESELERYEGVLEAAGDAVYALDLDGNHTMVNDRYVELTGYSREALLGEHVSMVLDEDDLETGRETVRRLLTTEATSAQYEETLRPAAGEPIPTEVRITLLEDDDGRARGSTGVIRDISERKERERELQRYRTVVQAAGDAIYALDPEGRFTMVNEWLTERTGYSREEMLGEHASIILDEAAIERGEAAIRELLSSGKRVAQFEATNRTADGETFPTEIRTAPLLDDDGAFAGTVGISRDVSERTERERELERYETIFEELNDGVYVLDDAGRFVYVNESYASMKGVDRETLIGSTVEEWADEQAIARARRTRERIQAGDIDVGVVETDLRTADGDAVPIELRLIEREGDDGLERIGVVRDITERTQRERERERQTERLETFASAVSHDLRNPLNVVQGSLELARSSHPEDPDLERAGHSLQRAFELIESLLALARADRETTTDTVELAALVEDCWTNVETGSAAFVVDTDRTLQADRSRFKQLIENLLRNAIEHGGDDVTVTVGELDGGFFIADDGPGIPEERRGQVFDAGYSEHESGTGFGLSIVQRIAEAHDWAVRATESDEGGARIEFTGVEFLWA
ncbi:PAS domain S-box protein [Natronomonas sp.]|uniref:PAS domain S-box protein n=1 Tax=Natronomonas sp. TaxID=2184060 RepID=UPI00260EA2EF|nr:PAS domain S-box protein [Natronomonas sp.]